MEDNNKKVDGLVHQMNTINSSFTSFKLVTLASIIGIVITAVAAFYIITTKFSEMSAKIYVLDNGASFSATAQDASITRKDEVTDHVMRFHEFMFNIPPNKDMIKRNLERALDMADKSAYNYYNDLQEKGFYSRMTGNNAYQQIEIDAIDINMETYPYQVTLRGFQYINRESNISQYSLVTQCTVANAVRTPQNLHGLMISNFKVVENRLIETRNK